MPAHCARLAAITAPEAAPSRLAASSLPSEVGASLILHDPSELLGHPSCFPTDHAPPPHWVPSDSKEKAEALQLLILDDPDYRNGDVTGVCEHYRDLL